MRASFPGCRDAIVATGAAGDHRHIRMEFSGKPAGVATLVTCRAVRGGRDVVAGLAGSGGAVVASCTKRGRREAAVIHLGPDPRAGRFMTAFTGRCGYQMAGRFARCRDAIVATGTAGDHGHIAVEFGRQPGGGTTLVAGFATGGSRHVVACFTGRIQPVVATGTASDDRNIGVERRWQPAGVTALVAGGAVSAGRDVIAGLAGGRCAVVAT